MRGVGSNSNFDTLGDNETSANKTQKRFFRSPQTRPNKVAGKDPCDCYGMDDFNGQFKEAIAWVSNLSMKKIAKFQ